MTARASEARQPRSLIKVGGEAVAGWVDWSWDGNTMFQADTFKVSFAMSALPKGKGVDWWAKQTDLDVEILHGFPADPAAYGESDLDSLFQGRVDDLTFAWDRLCIEVSGRDRTADLIDAKTSEKFPNQTASQIAETLAAKHGLNPVVTATSTKVGAYYRDTHTRLEDDRTEWDLLTWLAREEGFITYVQGKDLHFEPRKTDVGKAYRVEWRPPGPDGGIYSADHVRISTSRTLTVAKDITVSVRSWNTKQKKTFVRKAQRAGRFGKAQQYIYTIPGLTAEQAQARANQLLGELSRHEMRLQIDGPADNILGKGDIILLSGTGTAFDQTFYPDTIHRTFSWDEGYAWTVTAKNHSPESDPNL